MRRLVSWRASRGGPPAVVPAGVASTRGLFGAGRATDVLHRPRAPRRRNHPAGAGGPQVGEHVSGVREMLFEERRAQAPSQGRRDLPPATSAAGVVSPSRGPS